MLNYLDCFVSGIEYASLNIRGLLQNNMFEIDIFSRTKSFFKNYIQYESSVFKFYGTLIRQYFIFY